MKKKVLKKSLSMLQIKLIKPAKLNRLVGGYDGGGCACCMCEPGKAAAGDITATHD